MYVKTIDFSHPDAPELLSDSLRETGFAILKNHPISQELMSEVLGDWQGFFKNEFKNEYHYTSERWGEMQHHNGYHPVGAENAKGNQYRNLMEYFHYYSKCKLPEELSSKSVELFQKLKSFSDLLLHWLDKQLPEDIQQDLSEPLAKMVEGSKVSLFRFIHYPPLEKEAEEGETRSAEHEDIDLLTLLPSATAPGLQVKDREGNWHEVGCNPWEIIVNAGDMLQMATNEYYVSTTHRVVVPEGEARGTSRYSMPFFVHPRREVILKSGFTAGDYLYQRLVETGILEKAA